MLFLLFLNILAESKITMEAGGICFFSIFPTTFYVGMEKDFGDKGAGILVEALYIPFYSITTLMIEGSITINIKESHKIKAGIGYYRTIFNPNNEKEEGKGIGCRITYAKEYPLKEGWTHGIKLGFRWSDKVYGNEGGLMNFGFPVLGVDIAFYITRN